ncbi:sucrose transporter [Cordyceps militaris]|uniref:Sucrose transporter n=1 Tax=Cordyceps militaris TaxID=73501 RepID=A0A2H4SDZ7_CORMI|nr:sucrose transporter [Cordyceps militaris]
MAIVDFGSVTPADRTRLYTRHARRRQSPSQQIIRPPASGEHALVTGHHLSEPSLGFASPSSPSLPFYHRRRRTSQRMRATQARRRPTLRVAPDTYR